MDNPTPKGWKHHGTPVAPEEEGAGCGVGGGDPRNLFFLEHGMQQSEITGHLGSNVFMASGGNLVAVVVVTKQRHLLKAHPGCRDSQQHNCEPSRGLATAYPGQQTCKRTTGQPCFC